MGGQGHDLEAYRIPVFVLLPVTPFSVHPLSSEPLRVSGYTSTPSLDAFQAEGTRIHAEGHLPLTKKSVARAKARVRGHTPSHRSLLQSGLGWGGGVWEQLAGALNLPKLIRAP